MSPLPRVSTGESVATNHIYLPTSLFNLASLAVTVALLQQATVHKLMMSSDVDSSTPPRVSCVKTVKASRLDASKTTESPQEEYITSTSLVACDTFNEAAQLEIVEDNVNDATPNEDDTAIKYLTDSIKGDKLQ